MDVAISDESKLAMASAKGSGESDNTNGQKLLDLQSAKLVGGNKTFNDAYAALVSTVGSTTAGVCGPMPRENMQNRKTNSAPHAI